MELKVKVPFQRLLTLIKSLSPTEKAMLLEELKAEKVVDTDKEKFIDFLLEGPVYNEEEIAVIEENRKSIAEWRTKN